MSIKAFWHATTQTLRNTHFWVSEFWIGVNPFKPLPTKWQNGVLLYFINILCNYLTKYMLSKWWDPKKILQSYSCCNPSIAEQEFLAAADVVAASKRSEVRSDKTAAVSIRRPGYRRHQQVHGRRSRPEHWAKTVQWKCKCKSLTCFERF